MIKQAKIYLVAMMSLLLTGCRVGILDSQGWVGKQESELIIIASLLMLIVVLPVIFMTFFFAWKYREKAKSSRYAPEWGHSVKIESLIWGVPCAIILILAILAWRTSHELDPFKPLESEHPPVIVEVVALDWKWLFIYPQYGIATINHLTIPAEIPIAFKVTSDAAMNSFFIPQLGGQIYAMSGMQTQLHLIADEQGSFRGLSANISGQGFSGMHFSVTASSQQAFTQWVQSVKQSRLRLDKAKYNALSDPSENHPIQYFSYVEPQLFTDIIEKYLLPGKQDADRKFIIRQD